MTFAQALSDAAKASKNALLVVSIPASDIEVGGEAGKEALTRLSNVIVRQEASWKPASPEEGFEIVRRRLFDDVPAELARERDAVVNAFADLYQQHRRSSRSGCGRATTGGGSSRPIRSTRSCSTSCSRTGRRSRSSSAPAACCG